MPDPKWLKLTGWTFMVTTLASVTIFAQAPDTKDTPQTKSPATKTDAKSASATKLDPKAAPKSATEPTNATVSANQPSIIMDLAESFRDPRVDDAMNADLIKELQVPKGFTPGKEKEVLAMAAGKGDINPTKVAQFVEAKAADLTNKKSIETLLSGEGTVNTLVRPIESATKVLIKASRDSNAIGNTPFMSVYTAALIRVFQPLLKAHLVTRVQAVQVLASTGSLDVSPLLTGIIGDEAQPWQVKMIALEGINNVIQGGKRPIGFTQRTQLTVAVLNMLREEKSAPWFLKVQASKLIGNLRIVSELVFERKVVPAETLMGFLADSSERPEVRFEAARGLGLLDVPNQFRPYNYLLVTTALAELVAQTSTQVAALTPSDSSRTQQLVAIMVDKVSPAFLGIQGLIDSGILRQAEVGQADAATKAAISELFAKVKDVVNTAANYTRARGELIQARRADLQGRIVELQKLIDKHQPKDRTLTKGGKSFEIKTKPAPAQVAQGH